MNASINVVRLRQPEELEDPLTDVLRSGARRLLALAVELEAEAFLAGMQDLKLPDGRDRLVSTRLRSRADDPDRHRTCGGLTGEDPRSWRSQRWQPGPLLVIDPAQVGAPDAEPRRALADPLPARDLDRRLPGGACGAARPGRTEPVAFSDRSAKRGVAG